MPGMAANCDIFENIKLDDSKYKLHFIEWFEPEKEESLQKYSERIALQITLENPILIGVSFGGIIVQEIAKIIAVEKVIIISSVKDPSEFPVRIQWAKKWKLYRFFPTSYINLIENVTKKIVSSKKIKIRIEMYKKYLTVRSKNYLDWAFESIIEWENKNPVLNIVHIHGTKDHIFPHEKIKDAILLPNATHVLVLLQYKWLNKNLPQLILENTYEKELD